jgi:hypothetical protein
MRHCVISLSMFVCLMPAAGRAQDPAPTPDAAPTTRAETLHREREAKQRALRPNQPDPLQRGLSRIEDPPIFLVARDGWYPKIGKLTTGSGPALGIGYRNRTFLKRYGIADAWVAGTFRTYWGVETRLTFPDLARGRVLTEGVATLREFPREAFFGVGPDARRSDATSFRQRISRLTGRAGYRPWPAVLVGGALADVRVRSGDGSDEGLPPISTRFDAAAAPALGEDLEYGVTSGFVEIDYRQPRNARRGGWYRLDYSRYADRGEGRWSFSQTDLDLRQYFGFVADRRVVALRAWLSTTTPADGSQGTPFFLLPALGGHDTLRGFRNDRFRGAHALLLQAEYRWELWSGLDAALFYDAGQVAARRSDFELSRFEEDYGFGFRFNTSNGIVLRIDAAFGSRDGKHLYISLGSVF